MEAPNGEFNFTRLERVIFGPGQVAALPHELDRRGLTRAVVVTGKTLGASRLLDQRADWRRKFRGPRTLPLRFDTAQTIVA